MFLAGQALRSRAIESLRRSLPRALHTAERDSFERSSLDALPSLGAERASTGGRDFPALCFDSLGSRRGNGGGIDARRSRHRSAEVAPSDPPNAGVDVGKRRFEERA